MHLFRYSVVHLIVDAYLKVFIMLLPWSAEASKSFVNVLLAVK